MGREEQVQDILITITAILVTVAIIWLDGLWSTPVTTGIDAPSKQWLVARAKYHGVLVAHQGNDGQWYFDRKGKRCRLW